MDKRPQFGQDDVKMLEKSPLYRGFFKLLKYRFRHKLFAGGWSEDIEREMLIRGPAVAVLLYDPQLCEFVLIEQFRAGAIETSPTPWLLEVVAGIVEAGEDPESVCHREAKEEAGVEITALTRGISYLSSPGGTDERLFVYIGRCDASKASGIHGLDHEGEDILVHRVPEEDGLAWVNNGKIDNAASVIALQWFALNKQKVLDDWASGNR